MKRIYLDHAASTPVRPEVAAAMAPWQNEVGNPSSLHAEGRRARAAIDEARERVSQRMGSLFAEPIFTSGGTEATNWALIGMAEPGATILVGSTEHHCVLHTKKALASMQVSIAEVPVNPLGEWDLNFLEDHFKRGVRLVAAMHANNETGVRNRIAGISDLCKKHGAYLYIDAVQTFNEPWTVDDLGADLLSVSGHKIGGPKGVGALYVRAGTPLKPLLSGGGQERELRAGTENVAAIVGFGEAVTRMTPTPPVANDFTNALKGFERTPGDLPHIVHGRFPGVSAESLLIRLDRMGVSASSGAACSSGSLEPSHVVLAMGWTEEQAKEAMRFSFGWNSTAEEAREAAERVNEAVAAIQTARQR